MIYDFESAIPDGVAVFLWGGNECLWREFRTRVVSFMSEIAGFETYEWLGCFIYGRKA